MRAGARAAQRKCMLLLHEVTLHSAAQCLPWLHQACTGQSARSLTPALRPRAAASQALQTRTRPQPALLGGPPRRGRRRPHPHPPAGGPPLRPCLARRRPCAPAAALGSGLSLRGVPRLYQSFCGPSRSQGRVKLVRVLSRSRGAKHLVLPVQLQQPLLQKITVSCDTDGACAASQTSTSAPAA